MNDSKRLAIRLVFPLLGMCGAVFAQTAQLIYSDGLQNNWEDWSWCTRNLNNASPVHGGTKSISATCAGWEAISLGHGPFSTAPYSNLVFWAHGGSSGGQSLHIMARRNSQNPANFVWVGPLSAGTWQQCSVSLASLGVQNVSDCVGFWIRNYSQNPMPTFYLDDISLEETGESPPLPPPGTTIALEAESGVLIGTMASTSVPGYSGTGYVTGFDASGDMVRWTFGAHAGLYRFWIRFRSPFGSKGFDAVLNSAGITSTFPENAAFTMGDYGLVELVQGANTLQIGGGWNYYEIDRVDFVPASAPPPPLPVPPTLVDTQATFATRALMEDLAADYGRHTWSGQQEAYEADNVFSITGLRPAIVCGDFMDYSPSRIAFGANPGNYSESMIALENRGHVVSMSWHWNAPSGLLNTPEQPWWRGFYTAATTFDLAAALANTNSVQYGEILRDIDAIAVQVRKFSSNNIPILWRPLHESEGGWFWWGAKGPGPFKDLWRLLYYRLTGHHNLHNLIWVLTSTDPAWYPGNDVVDIVGADAYPADRGDALSPTWEALKARFDGVKLLALTEFGGVPDIERMQRFGVWWSWFSPWTGEYGPTSMPSEIVTRIYHSSAVITVEELNAVIPRISNISKNAAGAIELRGRGPRGAAYQILTSPQLELPPASWSQTCTGKFAGGVFTCTDPQSTNVPGRFYRVLKP